MHVSSSIHYCRYPPPYTTAFHSVFIDHVWHACILFHTLLQVSSSIHYCISQCICRSCMTCMYPLPYTIAVSSSIHYCISQCIYRSCMPPQSLRRWWWIQPTQPKSLPPTRHTEFHSVFVYQVWHLIDCRVGGGFHRPFIARRLIIWREIEKQIVRGYWIEYQ